MIYGIYGYRDNKSSFGPIWFDQNDEVAKRGFSMMMNNSDSIMGFAPGDFDLFRLGDFDSETGQITPLWPIKFLVNGRAVYLVSMESETNDK